MYLHELHIEGYKGFQESFSISLQKGLNVIVGENASGKTAIIDAIRLLLREDEFGHTPINESDFHRSFVPPQKSAQAFRLQAKFADLSEKEHVAFLPWSDVNGDASLTLLVDNKQNHRGHYKRTLWGGVSQASMFEWELFDSINCVYLPPLRDAEARLSEGRASRLARLLKNLQRQAIKEAKKKGELLPIEENVRDFNKNLSDDKEGVIAKANELIRSRLRESFGPVFGQDTHIQFSEVNFNRIAESLRLMFFPNINVASSEEFRTLMENSLGYNNLLYLATVLAELTETYGNEDYFSVLLIEEPEAHLHPQLQIRLLKYLESTARDKNVQVIVTTHSPVLASSVSLETVIQLCVRKPQAIALRSCGLSKPSSAFLNRWLDTTKSTLLFARGIILVEGIAEAMLLPELAKIVLLEYDELPKTLEDGGVSVINMNGIYFKHFMQLFTDLGENGSKSIPVRCAGITDNDPLQKDSKPIPSNLIPGTNPALKLLKTVNASNWARLYSSPLKTFEYDLAFCENNIQIMANVLAENWPTDGSVRSEIQKLANKEWGSESEENKKEAASEILARIEDNNMGKGLFSQLLADHIKSGTSIVVPGYICKAIIWSCGGNPDES